MFKSLKRIDGFSRNIAIVFAGTSLANLFNLLYQLLIAHKLSPDNFAAFNSLLSVFVVVGAPVATLQLAVAKYGAEFHARGQTGQLKSLLSGFLKKALISSGITFVFFWLASGYLIGALKIPSLGSGLILTLLLASIWINPVLLGGAQGLELFKLFTSVSIIGGAIKLCLGALFVILGYNVAGALGAILFANLACAAILYFGLRGYFNSSTLEERTDYKKILVFLLPLAITQFCFNALVNFDMVLVKYFYSSWQSGIYSLSQMVGKIFLFLPGAVSIVMYPKTSGLNARNLDTTATLKKSLLYGAVLCLIAALGYNFFPRFILQVLTGKSYGATVLLGRLFSVSMSFFTLVYIFLAYFLSINDLRFIKYLVISLLLQVAAISLIHQTLMQAQLILCINSIILFFICLFLVSAKRK